MIASGITLRLMAEQGAPIVEPFVSTKTIQNGMSYGCSHAGYDIRIAEDIYLYPGEFSLGSTIEKFCMPTRLLGIVHDKSSWARKGLSVFNTVIEPGWTGFLTVELSNKGSAPLDIKAGDPIAQVVFHVTDRDCVGYDGKYQNQESGPQVARLE